MALPSLSKTWDVDPNNAGGTSVSTLEDHQRTLFAIKEGLVGSGEVTAPWAVISSSDSSTADASDNWSAYTDLVWAATTSAHSWIVLEDPTGDHQICIDCNSASSTPRLMRIVWSPSGSFSGGSTTARPTAGDEVDVVSLANWMNTYTGTFTSKVHVQVSDDGEASIVTVFVGGVCVLLWIMAELSNTSAGISDATFVHFSHGGSTSTQQARIAQLDDTNNSHMDDGGTPIDPRFGGEGYFVATNFTLFAQGQGTVNADSSDWPIGNVSLWSDVGGSEGKKGNIPDVFWGVDVNNEGDQFPDAGTFYQFTQIGDLIVAWDSTTQIQVT